ncbi:MAG TPA: transcriptional regulator [Microbacterium sp.]|jgi:putative transcriptional regulator|uniref:helix-turn-helix transcriptional regulator n=1 Tax=Microbacterium TaxID=33882 RepID=UPI000C4AFA55|nr:MULTISPECIES: helix-turn-helix transcriptional regulator [Microbacterium]MEC8761852.1 helix-turn-helix transcriptional regulator [Actinomycetota bacterium]MBU19881.1 transcriptional regulator [Microbacterium sp.]MCC4267942.1 helix-turn-helix transcriptional regulator [Microbacterium schleiferi]HBS08303.1 transcriptional regulator [Microbacterium sp.]HCU78657.1 transcriptional regulator [Microbacterium sp.]|tara:strand:- start:3297 stop:3533 length:237 start_codon:yes stop_codon:yes gene_type:complete
MVKPTRITNTIRATREAAGMTQAEVARHIGVTRQTLIAIEQGKYSPSLELAFQLSRLFGMTIDDLFEYPTDAPDGVSA